MKRIYTFILYILSTSILQAQEFALTDNILIASTNLPEYEQISSKQQVLQFFNKPINSQSIYSAHISRNSLEKEVQANDLRAPIWKPAAEVIGLNLLFMGFNRYVANADYGYVTFKTIKHNLKTEPEWDTDQFGINFIGHPYQGTLYFNAARSQGYNYWQSLPFAIGGSLTWEYFGENTLPSYNDMIYTPLNGAALGEILYRVSSKILDDRATGKERMLRELAAGLLNPVRGVNRLLQGKTQQVDVEQTIEDEPVNLTLFTGLHRLNEMENEDLGKGGTNGMLSLQLDYGRPFEDKKNKPFDFFRLRAEFSIGSADTIGSSINNVTGYGILAGHNLQVGKLALLTGAFQYYDYWNTRNFELGVLGFGGGVFSKYELGKQTNLYTNTHLGLIPLAGNSTRSAPDSLGFRNYVYATGLQGKIESTLTIGDHATVAVAYYHFWLNTFEGLKGNNSIGIIRPRVTLRLFKNLSLGYEHFGYTTNRRLEAFADQHSAVTEQKIFLQLFWEAPQRSGRYN